MTKMLMELIKLDLNTPSFQHDFFGLQSEEQVALLKTLKKISQMTWVQLYQDKGLHWEAILSKQGHQGQRLYSLRFSKKYRATAMRQDAFLRLLTLHTDHDSAYR